MIESEPTTRLSQGDLVDLTRKHVFFSWSIQEQVDPIAIDSGKGVYFWDPNGKQYLDFSAQLMNLNIGYQHPKVIAAIQDQATVLCAAHPNMAHEPKALLGKMITEVAPKGLNKVFFTLGGAEANENAIKFARLFTGKQKILTRYISYHGATYGAISLSGDYRRLPVEPGIPGVVHVFDPYCYRCPFGHTRESCHRECVTHIEKVIEYEGPKGIAALLMEGVTGSNGILVPPDDYWPRLREITQKYDILLISDEVMSGFGRTGTWFAVDHWDVIPDIMTLAKGLTSGYLPLGAVVVSDEIARHFDDRMLYMGLTYFGHPMSCAAAVATLKIYSEENLIVNSKNMGIVLGEGLEEIKRKHAIVGDVRYIGLFSVIELVQDRDTKTPLAVEKMGTIKSALLADGLTTFVNKNMVFICPPLCINQEELRVGLGIIDRAIEKVEKS